MKILNICKTFFDFLYLHDIRYCHWKSNSHLEGALNGDTDLDLLIHFDDKKEFEKICEKFEFKNIISPPEKQFPDLEDYLGFDYETGHLIHLHIHYRLILGQKYIKNHHLPIEDIFFKNIIFRNDIAIPTPELELILLIIRAHMKMDFLSMVKHCIRDFQVQYYCPFPNEIEDELFSLVCSCDLNKFKDILFECDLPLSEDLLIDFVNLFYIRKYRWIDAFRTERKIVSSLKKYRRQKGLSIYFKYFYHFLINSRVFAPYINHQKKTIVGKGKIFSLVGADGSGKSTLTSDLQNWLSWKMSVKKYYYGIPKTILVKVIDYSIQVTKKFKLTYATTFIEKCLWLFIAKLRYKVFLSSNEDVDHGQIVLTDRFPLKEFQKMKEPMDGPRLSQSTTKSGLYFSQFESEYYNRIKNPDYIFILQVDIDELRKRKTDLDISTHKAKATAVNAIKGNEHIILIDANQSYQDVQLELKRKIWICI